MRPQYCRPAWGSRSWRAATRAAGAAWSSVVTGIALKIAPPPGDPAAGPPDATPRLLILRLDGIGDMVLSTPVLRELRANFPDARITLLVQPTVENLVARCPYVDEVRVFDCWIPLALRPLVLPWRAWRIARRLGHGWRMAIVPRWGTDAWCGTLVAYLVGAARRIGYSERVTEDKRWFNCGFDRLLTDVLPGGGTAHETDRGLAVVQALGGTVASRALELWADAEDEAYIDALLERVGIRAGDALIAIAPSGGSSTRKQWPIGHAARLGQQLAAAYRVRLLAVGGPGDVRLAREVARHWGAAGVAVAGETTLRQTAALLRRCRLLVGNDTAPLHIAAAVGTPVVGLYGPTDERRFSPCGRRHQIRHLAWPCRESARGAGGDITRHCRSACLAALDVDSVFRACRAVLDDASGSALDGHEAAVELHS